MSHMSNLKGLENRIKTILYDYLKVESFTNTKGEELVDDFFNEVVGKMSYFKKYPELYGQYKTKDPLFNRHVSYALYKGSPETFVMIHHSDVVNVDNYGIYKELAFSPDALSDAYLKDSSFLNDEAKRDLQSGKYLFGRGTADMKAGGAIELALLEHYSNEGIKPSILIIAVPDEENESLGMRHAIHLLKELKDKHGLEYQLMINTEPHQRMNDEKGVISQGSIGKLNVFVHVKGVLAHAGKALEGINSNGLLANIVRHVDLNEAFVNETKTEMSIPPTWVTMRDNKKIYDISFPSMSYGILNVLNYTDTPTMVLEKLKSMVKKASDEYIDHVNQMRNKFSSKTGREWLDFNKLKKIYALDEFVSEFNHSMPVNYPEDLEDLMVKSNDGEPLIVIGLLPPYYPAITNDDQETLMMMVNDFTIKAYNQQYDNRMYFTGISDLSYSKLPSENIASEMSNILGWGTLYDIPFEVLKDVEMPCINIGPWGKDFHKPSERVYKEDVFIRTPSIIHNVIHNYKGGNHV